LSISELFSGVHEKGLTDPVGLLDGRHFWDILSTPTRADNALGRTGHVPSEVRYAFDEPGSRFNRETGVPPISTILLPLLSAKPDELFDELARNIVKWPRQALTKHYLRFFELLAGPTDAVVVERSGGSSDYAHQLYRLFPTATVVHLYRDGRESAYSMSRHSRYRMALIRRRLVRLLGVDPYLDSVPMAAVDALRTRAGDMEVLFPDRITRAAFEEFQPRIEEYGLMWSKMIVSQASVLHNWRNRVDVDYRQLTADPVRELRRLLQFLGLQPDMDEELVRTEIRAEEPAKWLTLCPTLQQSLTKSCSLGMNVLYGRDWE
jgi:hypothetical protein